MTNTDTDTKTVLYAIASMVRQRNGDWTPSMTHVHAVDAAHARWIFTQDPIHVKRHRIIGIAPVVGYHVEDEHGEVLRA